MKQRQHDPELAIVHPSQFQLYRYAAGPRYDPGALAEIFVPKYNLPVISFRGAGRLAGAMRPLQPAQVWFHRQVGIVGLGGVQAGQVVRQPLYDPSTAFEGA